MGKPAKTSPKAVGQAYKEGDLVFAKIRFFPYWPARIEEASGKDKFKVKFYSTHDTSHVKTNMIEPYNSETKEIYGKNKKVLKGIWELENDPDMTQAETEAEAETDKIDSKTNSSARSSANTSPTLTNDEVESIEDASSNSESFKTASSKKKSRKSIAKVSPNSKEKSAEKSRPLIKDESSNESEQSKKSHEPSKKATRRSMRNRRSIDIDSSSRVSVKDENSNDSNEIVESAQKTPSIDKEESMSPENNQSNRRKSGAVKSSNKTIRFTSENTNDSSETHEMQESEDLHLEKSTLNGDKGSAVPLTITDNSEKITKTAENEPDQKSVLDEKNKTDASLIKNEPNLSVKDENIFENSSDKNTEAIPEAAFVSELESVQKAVPETPQDKSTEVLPITAPEAAPSTTPENMPEIKSESTEKISKESVLVFTPENIPEVKPEPIGKIPEESVPEIPPNNDKIDTENEDKQAAMDIDEKFIDMNPENKQADINASNALIDTVKNSKRVCSFEDSPENSSPKKKCMPQTNSDRTDDIDMMDTIPVNHDKESENKKSTENSIESSKSSVSAEPAENVSKLPQSISNDVQLKAVNNSHEKCDHKSVENISNQLQIESNSNDTQPKPTDHQLNEPESEDFQKSETDSIFEQKKKKWLEMTSEMQEATRMKMIEKRSYEKKKALVKKIEIQRALEIMHIEIKKSLAKDAPVKDEEKCCLIMEDLLKLPISQVHLFHTPGLFETINRVRKYKSTKVKELANSCHDRLKGLFQFSSEEFSEKFEKEKKKYFKENSEEIKIERKVTDQYKKILEQQKVN